MMNYLTKIFHHRELLWNIALREIKVRYKQSILGILWAIIQPLSLMIIFTVVFSKFARIQSDNIPYPIFSYSALLPWSFFATALSFAIPSLVTNSSIVTKIYFPREIFPIASILAAFVDFCIAALVFVALLFFYNINITWNILFFVPIMLIQIIFTAGVALFASAINVYYRDVKYALPLVIQLWMYATPIIYPLSLVPERIKIFYMLNPMAPIIDGYRRVLLKGIAPDFFYLGVAFFVSIVLFVLSYAYFKSVEMNLADII